VSVWEKHPLAKQIVDDRTFGQRAADRMRNTMGSWPFVFAFFAVMILWAFVNTILKIGNPPSTSSNKGFDPYPYILLNLFLSMLAGIQAAALLIAAKRSDHIASIIAVDTDENTKQIKAGLDQEHRPNPPDAHQHAVDSPARAQVRDHRHRNGRGAQEHTRAGRSPVIPAVISALRVVEYVLCAPALGDEQRELLGCPYRKVRRHG